jgi:hypothetical protein
MKVTIWNKSAVVRNFELAKVETWRGLISEAKHPTLPVGSADRSQPYSFPVPRETPIFIITSREMEMGNRPKPAFKDTPALLLLTPLFSSPCYTWRPCPETSLRSSPYSETTGTDLKQNLIQNHFLSISKCPDNPRATTLSGPPSKVSPTKRKINSSEAVPRQKRRGRKRRRSVRKRTRPKRGMMANKVGSNAWRVFIQ